MRLRFALPLLLLYFQPTWVYGSSSFAQAKNDSIHLRSDGAIPAHFIIDHGHDINGFTTFHVEQASGDTSAFIISHSETRALLDNLQVDCTLSASSRHTNQADPP